ncbi:glycosyltransferase family 2 protein [Desulfomicrobium escambiense]|uniref:glycosyltransferase family 2 protein n=1 Tax=Desulfomicrobium escambiense TaxID=29503 RepID=UPI0009FDD8EE|nr:glycosyltransferase family 2 protein [Desulfomicrobium escambiense]
MDISREHEKKISILVPLYNYYDGILRIVKFLDEEDLSEVEVIVLDDSDNPDEQLRIQKLLINYKHFIKYRHNHVSLGPVINWNALLDMASADYIILMHHDEFLLSKKFIKNAIDRIENIKFDVGIFNCFLMRGSNIYKQHLSISLRYLFYKFLPIYIFKRNFIGPTASLIVKRSLCERFDSNLRWLVDVDWYYRLAIKTRNIVFFKDIAVCSEIDANNSITRKIKFDLPHILKSEEIYLSKKYNKSFLFFLTGSSLFCKAFCIVESLAWKTLSIFCLIFQRMN